MNIRQKGYTLTKLLKIQGIIVIIIVVFFAIDAVLAGNYWYSTDLVEHEMKIEHPEVTSVLKTTRNVRLYSKILVMEGGKRNTYYLDSDIFHNYDFFTSQK